MNAASQQQLLRDTIRLLARLAQLLPPDKRRQAYPAIATLQCQLEEAIGDGVFAARSEDAKDDGKALIQPHEIGGETKQRGKDAIHGKKRHK